MTVTYTSQVSDCKGFGCFWKLLFRWRGSIYKLVWPDLLAYSFLYFLLSAIYRFVLNENGRKVFEMISLYTANFTDLIPIAFVLGFYVSIVVQRWWAQFESLPWPDTLSLYISTSIPGNDNRARIMRRTIVRYANLAFTLTLIMVSPRVKKRFPSMDHLVEAGLLMANERKIIEDMQAKSSHPLYWMPLVWAGTVVARARKEGRIRDDFAVKTIVDEINRLRGVCGTLLGYDWISVPLVYTQVVTLAVYTFFLSTLMGRQFLDPRKNYDKHDVDLYFPVFTYLQFFFYMGWLKVAETLVNPFGEDDDDFEVNWLVDRNLQVSYLIVDEMHNEHPELIQDIYWDEVFPQELPYTIAAQEFRTEPPQGSTYNMEVPLDEQDFLPIVEEEVNNDELSDSDIATPTLSINHFRKVGSTLSNMLQPSSFGRSSVRSFINRAGSNSSMLRVPSGGKNLQRTFSKSSAITINSNRGKNPRRMSDNSFSGSDGNVTDPQLISSKESLSTEKSPSRQRRFKKRSASEDEGVIVINWKNDKPETTIEISGPDEQQEKEPMLIFGEPNIINGSDPQTHDNLSIQSGASEPASRLKPPSHTLPEKKNLLSNRLSLSSLKSFKDAAEAKDVEEKETDDKDVAKTGSPPSSQKYADILKQPIRKYSLSSISETTKNGNASPLAEVSYQLSDELLSRHSLQIPSNESYGRKYHQPRGPLLLGLSSGLPSTSPEKPPSPSLPIEIMKNPRDTSPYLLSSSPEHNPTASSTQGGHRKIRNLSSSELETVNEQAENESTSLL